MKDEELISKMAENGNNLNKEELLEWANSSDENREEFYRLKNLIALTGSTLHTQKASENELSGILAQIRQRSRSRTMNMILQVSKYAAAIIVAVLLTRLFLTPELPAVAEKQWLEISTSSGQTTEMTMPDGTKVWMNSLTTLKYPTNFENNNREVLLSGEAYFKVERNENAPFTVRTAGYNVKVLGTSFNVSAYPNDKVSKTVLVEGKIELTNNTGTEIKTLNPGQLFTFDTVKKSFSVSQVSTDYYTSWKEGYFAFDHESLESISAKLERIYAVKISIPDQKIRDISFTGTIMKNKPLEQILRIIELTAPIKVNLERLADKEDQVTITAKI